MLIHLVPQGTPIILTPFKVCIKTLTSHNVNDGIDKQMIKIKHF